MLQNLGRMLAQMFGRKIINGLAALHKVVLTVNQAYVLLEYFVNPYVMNCSFQCIKV